MDYHVVIFILGVVWFILVQIYRFFQWIATRIKTVNTTPSPIQQAIADAQKQARPQQAPVARPRPAPAPRQQRPEAAFGRRPEAGGPAVPVPATDADFQRQIQQMVAEEPNAPIVSMPATTVGQARPLFSGTDDLVRAIILQEVFGPPLSRRQPPAPRTSAPPQ